MFRTTLLDFIPLWAVFLGSTFLVLASIEIGFRIGVWRAKRTKKSELPHTGGSVAATLGLLGFMLAFTFGTTTSRWDDRKSLVLDEANALGTAYLRAELLPEPQQSNVRRLLENYLELSLGLDEKANAKRFEGVGQLGELKQFVELQLSEANTLQSQLWQEAMTAYRLQPTPGTNLFITAINEVFDIQQSRITKALDQRMPTVFWVTLYTLAMLSMGLSGYDAGLARGGRTLSPWVVAAAFSSVLLLIVALDRPQTSVVSKAPLADLARSISGSASR